jgi:hypothetical protein
LLSFLQLSAAACHARATDGSERKRAGALLLENYKPPKSSSAMSSSEISRAEPVAQQQPGVSSVTPGGWHPRVLARAITSQHPSQRVEEEPTGRVNGKGKSTMHVAARASCLDVASTSASTDLQRPPGKAKVAELGSSAAGSSTTPTTALTAKTASNVPPSASAKRSVQELSAPVGAGGQPPPSAKRAKTTFTIPTSATVVDLLDDD